MPEAEVDTDILIIGAGPVGMALALALAGSSRRVLLLDRRPRGDWAGDPRALALSHGSRQLLERIKAWNASSATAIREIHVSQRGGFGRTLIDTQDYGTPALGYVMRYRDLARELDARIGADQCLAPCRVDRLEAAEHGVTVAVTHAGQTRQITAQLVVHAEGAPDEGPGVKVRDYGQQGVVAELRTASSPAHRAWERFTPEGPLALLPLGSASGRDYSMVLTVPVEKAERLLRLDDEGFLAALREQFGQRLEFTACGPRTSFPLALRVRSQIVSQRQVWIGNAAQSLHPVSGQGFNLGLRDAWELAGALLDQPQSDAGDPQMLAAYARGRRLDRAASQGFTDSLVRVFSNDFPPLQQLRGLGLLALDLYPPLRHFVARRMIWGARAWP